MEVELGEEEEEEEEEMKLKCIIFRRQSGAEQREHISISCNFNVRASLAHLSIPANFELTYYMPLVSTGFIKLINSFSGSELAMIHLV